MDREIDAIAKVMEILEPLEEEGRRRVAAYLAQRVGVAEVGSQQPAPHGRDLASFSTVADAFAAAGPQKGSDKALVVAAYLQASQQSQELTGAQVNKALRDLGHGVKDITTAMQANIDCRPSLMLQLRKSGKSRQAKKTYKVSDAGMSRVDEMLKGTTQSENTE